MKKRAMSLLMALVMVFSLLGTTATAWADDSGTKVPTLIEGVSPTAEATVQTGMSYMMSDLHFGKIFWDNQKNRRWLTRRAFTISGLPMAERPGVK